ncbi:MAG TPA: hypothetical protein VN638_06580 [Nitrospiraceae bacterium]|nr:hypothetical protein [Nitrospiraceae bacterium]
MELYYVERNMESTMVGTLNRQATAAHGGVIAPPRTGHLTH